MKNKYGKNACQKIIKIKKKLLVKPTCSLSLTKKWVHQGTPVKVTINQKNANVIQIDGQNVKDGFRLITLDKVGKHRFSGFVKKIGVVNTTNGPVLAVSG